MGASGRASTGAAGVVRLRRDGLKADPRPEENPEPRPEENPEPRPEENPEPRPEENPEPRPEENPEPRPEENPDPRPEENPEPRPEENPEPRPEENPEPRPEENPEPRPEENPEPRPEENPEPRPEENPEPPRYPNPLAPSADSPSGEPPSEALEAEPLLCESPVWDVFIAFTKRHKKQFEEEFLNEANYDFLERTEIPSPPAGCPVTLNKEACLLRLVQGLQWYKVLLMHVKREYPDNSLLPHIKYNSDLLIKLIKEKMRHPERLVVLSDTEAQNVLQRLDNTNMFLRKLTAHSILRKLHLFLIDGSRDLARKENVRYNYYKRQ
ncbi:unnamed protein product [Lota lota]